MVNVQMRITYHSSVLVDVTLEQWNAMTDKEREDAVWKAENGKPSEQFSAGHIDMDDPNIVEFWDPERWED